MRLLIVERPPSDEITQGYCNAKDLDTSRGSAICNEKEECYAIELVIQHSVMLTYPWVDP